MGGDLGHASPPGRAAPPVHSTTPLEQLGGGATFVRSPPAIDYEAAADTPPDTEGAKKFAACVSLVFRLALDDAVERYDLAELGAELGGGLTADNVTSAKAAACSFVFAHAERCALKHGLGVSIPYEDEIVTIAAGGGGLLYLLAKFTGRLDRRSAEPPRPGANGRANPPARGLTDDVDDVYTPIRAQARDAR